MTTNTPETGLQLRTKVTNFGTLELSLVPTPVPALKDGEVLMRIEASPINPSDLGLLVGTADVSTATTTGSGGNAVTTLTIPPHLVAAMAARLDESLPVGNEAAGTIIAAGASPEAQELLGTIVAGLGGAMYGQYRVLKARDCLKLPAGTTAAEAASCFVNPLTSLGMVETMRLEGHKALVHTAAASNLGQMLNKLCQAEGVPLVNVVRSAEQAKILHDAGAEHVVDTSLPSFRDDLVAALVATGATIAFDAIGGGKLAGQILSAMEVAANKTATTYSRYGSTTYKQVYIYGGLNTAPTELSRSFGMSWGLGGWLLTPFLMKIGPEAAQKLRERVAAGLKAIFTSHYTRTISLVEALQPETLIAYNRRATGEKFLIDPTKGL